MNKIIQYDINSAVVTRCGAGVLFEAPNTFPVIILKGSPYEKGYEYGKLLGNRLKLIISNFTTFIYACKGGWQPDGHTVPTMAQIQAGKRTVRTMIYRDMVPVMVRETPEYWDMLRGEYDGIRAVGVAIEFDDLLAVNTVPECYDNSQGCSSFAAWGDATVDGKLVHAMNLDQNTFGFLHKNIVVLIEENESGYTNMGPTYLGCIFAATFINEAGLSYGEMTSRSTPTAWPQLPHYWQAKLIAGRAATLDEAVAIAKHTGGTTGWVNLIASACPSASAVAIEAVADQIGVRHTTPQRPDRLYATNHFRAFPGFEGYEGPNLMREQLELYSTDPKTIDTYFSGNSLAWKDIDTYDKWKLRFSCPRFEQYERMLDKYHGQIDINLAIALQSMEPLSIVPENDEPEVLTPPFMQLYDIFAPIVNQALRSLYSCIMKPQDGTIWVAAGEKPAQKGTFVQCVLKTFLDASVG